MNAPLLQQGQIDNNKQSAQLRLALELIPSPGWALLPRLVAKLEGEQTYQAPT